MRSCSLLVVPALFQAVAALGATGPRPSLILQTVHPGPGFPVRFTPDAKALITSDADGVRSWRMSDRALLDFCPGVLGRYPTAVSPDGRTELTFHYTEDVLRRPQGCQLRLTNISTGRLIASRPVWWPMYARCRFLEDRPALVSETALGYVEVMGMTGPVRRLALRENEEIATFTSDAVVLAAKDDPNVHAHLRFWRPFHDELPVECDLPHVYLATVGVDGSAPYVCVADKRDTLYEIDTRDGSRRLVGSSAVRPAEEIEYTPDGNYLLILGDVGYDESAAVDVLDRRNGQRRGGFRAPRWRSIGSLVVSPNSRLCAGVISQDQVAEGTWLWSLPDGGTIYRFPKPAPDIDQIVPLTDGRSIATVHNNLVFAIWDLSSARMKWSRPAAELSHRRPNVSPDGSYVAADSGMQEPTRIFSLRTGALALTDSRYVGWEGVAEYSPDGRTVVIATNAGIGNGNRDTNVPMARAYELPSGKLLRVFGPRGFCTLSSAFYTNLRTR